MSLRGADREVVTIFWDLDIIIADNFQNMLINFLYLGSDKY